MTLIWVLLALLAVVSTIGVVAVARQDRRERRFDIELARIQCDVEAVAVEAGIRLLPSFRSIAGTVDRLAHRIR